MTDADKELARLAKIVLAIRAVEQIGNAVSVRTAKALALEALR